MFNIGIVGHGFVGSAVANAFCKVDYYQDFAVSIYDPKYEGTSLEELYDASFDYIEDELDIIFVCVPTPQNDDGSIDSSIVTETVNKLLENTRATIVIKSTVVPSAIIEHERVLYNPEFLTERNSNEDFINAPYHIIGGDLKTMKALELAYTYSSVKNNRFIRMSVKEASFVKYAINTFLATKVIFFNQLYDLAKEHNCNWDNIIDAVTLDDRVSEGHTKVADHGRKRGFGGACFPKDINAFLQFSENNFSLLKAVIDINNTYRKDYDLDDREKGNNITF